MLGCCDTSVSPVTETTEQRHLQDSFQEVPVLPAPLLLSVLCVPGQIFQIVGSYLVGVFRPQDFWL